MLNSNCESPPKIRDCQSILRMARMQSPTNFQHHDAMKPKIMMQENHFFLFFFIFFSLSSNRAMASSTSVNGRTAMFLPSSEMSPTAQLGLVTLLTRYGVSPIDAAVMRQIHEAFGEADQGKHHLVFFCCTESSDHEPLNPCLCARTLL